MFVYYLYGFFMVVIIKIICSMLNVYTKYILNLINQRICLSISLVEINSDLQFTVNFRIL